MLFTFFDSWKASRPKVKIHQKVMGAARTHKPIQDPRGEKSSNTNFFFT